MGKARKDKDIWLGTGKVGNTEQAIIRFQECTHVGGGLSQVLEKTVCNNYRS